MTLWANKIAGRSPHDRQPSDRPELAQYWSVPPEQLFRALQASPQGLSAEDAQRRLADYGPNALKAGGQATALGLLFNQFKSPLVLILVFAAIISLIAGEWPDAVIVLAVVLGSTTLGFVREYRANTAIEKLRHAAGTACRSSCRAADRCRTARGGPRDGSLESSKAFAPEEAAGLAGLLPWQAVARGRSELFCSS